ncbi:MAG: DUF1223 domain-containing protein [Caulobacteraceae bacterium]
MTHHVRSLAPTLLATVLGIAGATPLAAAEAAHPLVLELFQSQGCSSCPPANANVSALTERPDILVLSFGVTYWDRLGWKDTFASPRYTARQWDYARGLGHADVFTPQVVINGRRDGTGIDRRGLAALIIAGDRGVGGPAIGWKPRAVTVSAAAAPAGGADVWLVRYDPRIVHVPIKRGENAGRTLPHKNIVRELTRLGAWRGRSETLALPPAGDPALRTAVLVQTAGGGPVLAASKG